MSWVRATRPWRGMVMDTGLLSLGRFCFSLVVNRCLYSVFPTPDLLDRTTRTHRLQGQRTCQHHTQAARTRTCQHHTQAARTENMSTPHTSCKDREHVNTTHRLQGQRTCQHHTQAARTENMSTPHTGCKDREHVNTTHTLQRERKCQHHTHTVRRKKMSAPHSYH